MDRCRAVPRRGRRCVISRPSGPHLCLSFGGPVAPLLLRLAGAILGGRGEGSGRATRGRRGPAVVPRIHCHHPSSSCLTPRGRRGLETVPRQQRSPGRRRPPEARQRGLALAPQQPSGASGVAGAACCCCMMLMLCDCEDPRFRPGDQVGAGRERAGDWWRSY